MQWIEGPVATAARSLGGYGRHSRKYSYSFVTIRQLLTRCGARMPLTNCRRQSTSRSRMRHKPHDVLSCHRGSPRPREAQTTARDARRTGPFSGLDFQKEPAHPDFKKAAKARRYC
jgi:hypothetical protein